MGGKNKMLEMLEEAKRVGFRGGLESGRQQIMDMVSLVLHEKFGFGKDRLVTVVDGIGEYIDKYQPAWEKSVETDYYQNKLDNALADAYGDGLRDSFHKRYPYAPEYDYMKGKWKR